MKASTIVSWISIFILQKWSSNNPIDWAVARDSELEPPLFLFMTQLGQTNGRTGIGEETSLELESDENKDSKICQ